MIAVLAGTEIARSDATVVVEGNHYFPIADVRTDLLDATQRRSLCPWKGIASYWTVHADGAEARNAAWTYRHPTPFARRVRGRVAFWGDVEVCEAP